MSKPILCLIGIHPLSVTEEIPNDLSDMYEHSKSFISCGCGSQKKVLLLGNTKVPRNFMGESVWIENKEIFNKKGGSEILLEKPVRVKRSYASRKRKKST